jgi:ATP-binding cassette subfamily A (ABC1) protein 1
MLRRWLPGTRLYASAGTEMTFVLPTDKDADFYSLFQDLEAQVQSLGIVSYGISDPHLEEVCVSDLI